MELIILAVIVIILFYIFDSFSNGCSGDGSQHFQESADSYPESSDVDVFSESSCDTFTDPMYSWMPGNIYYTADTNDSSLHDSNSFDDDYYYSPAYNHMPCNIWYDPWENDNSFSSSSSDDWSSSSSLSDDWSSSSSSFDDDSAMSSFSSWDN